MMPFCIGCQLDDGEPDFMALRPSLQSIAD
jgi:hypothetical protein